MSFQLSCKACAHFSVNFWLYLNCFWIILEWSFIEHCPALCLFLLWDPLNLSCKVFPAHRYPGHMCIQFIQVLRPKKRFLDPSSLDFSENLTRVLKCFIIIFCREHRQHKCEKSSKRSTIICYKATIQPSPPFLCFPSLMFQPGSERLFFLADKNSRPVHFMWSPLKS